jgi:hypothetical protein
MFTVRWTQVALNQLTALWTQANTAMRQAITAATHQIVHQLSQAPGTQGESREGNERIMFVLPLGIRFAVDSQNARVRVLYVWSCRRRA